MLERFRRLPARTRRAILVALIAALPLVALAIQSLAVVVLGARLRAAAAERNLRASWRSLAFGTPFKLYVRDLVVRRATRGDTLFVADSFSVALDPLRLLVFSARPSRLELAHASLTMPGGAGPAADTAAAETAPRQAGVSGAAAERLRRSAGAFARLLLAPARSLPELRVHDVTFRAGAAADDERAGGWIDVLELTRLDTGRTPDVRLSGSGRFALEQQVPFEFALEYAADDRLRGRWWFAIPDSARRTMDSLAVRVEGSVRQDRRHGQIDISDDTRIWIGDLALRTGGRITRRGPRIDLHLEADGFTQQAIERSVPPALLGPLTSLSVSGSFDYRLAFDLDFSRPDSVSFTADVVPHDLALEADSTGLPILGLDEPFIATIHLPHGRVAVRELSAANPYYRPLEGIDSVLTYAVIANEDGGFFRHRGFNLDAVRSAITENLRAGSYRRGAGTITMQVARNLYLGHERTLSRKAQEVVLAWVLEHLTGLSKERLLEIYLNIVEWGPDVHGAAEAARYYFAADPGHLTPAQALFLTTLLPAPARWRGRVGRDGLLRLATRQQMHFIGRAMVGKGWLDAAALPVTDSLQVVFAGAAREALLSPAPAAAPANGVARPPLTGASPATTP